MNCKIIGYDLKCLEITLSQGEKFYAENSALIYCERGISRNLKVLDNGVWGMIKRSISGESIVQVEYTNQSFMDRKMVVAGKSGLVPISLSEFNGGIICKRGYYVASSKQVDVDVNISVNNLFSGLGLVLQKISGEGTVFLDCIGSPLKLEVKANDGVLIDEKSFVCMSRELENRMQPNISGTSIFGGEGLSLLDITGPGIVYMNSVNFRTV